MQEFWDTPSVIQGVKIYTDEEEETFIVSDVLCYMDFNDEYKNE